METFYQGLKQIWNLFNRFRLIDSNEISDMTSSNKNGQQKFMKIKVSIRLEFIINLNNNSCVIRVDILFVDTKTLFKLCAFHIVIIARHYLVSYYICSTRTVFPQEVIVSFNYRLYRHNFSSQYQRK